MGVVGEMVTIGEMSCHKVIFAGTCRTVPSSGSREKHRPSKKSNSLLYRPSEIGTRSKASEQKAVVTSHDHLRRAAAISIIHGYY